MVMDMNKVIKTEKPVDDGLPQNNRTFGWAMEQVLQGKRLHRTDWKDKGWYVVMHEGRLKIHRPDDQKVHPWTVKDVDMKGKDWVIL